MIANATPLAATAELRGACCGIWPGAPAAMDFGHSGGGGGGGGSPRSNQEPWSGALRAPGEEPERVGGAGGGGSPRAAPKKQLGRAQVRAMVRIQMRMAKIPESAVSDAWIDALFDRFDADGSGLMDDGEWDTLLVSLANELKREAARPPRRRPPPSAAPLTRTDARLARVMADSKKPPRVPDRRIHKPQRAATRIQAAWRGFWVRSCLKAGRQHLSLHATKIQAAFRGLRARQETKHRREFNSGAPGGRSLRLPPSFVPATAFVPASSLVPEPEHIVVTVPAGMKGGDHLRLTSGDGDTIDVEIPEGLAEGDEFEAAVGGGGMESPRSQLQEPEPEPEVVVAKAEAERDAEAEALRQRLAELTARRALLAGKKWQDAVAAKARKSSPQATSSAASARKLQAERHRNPARAALRSSHKLQTEWHRTNASAAPWMVPPAATAGGLVGNVLRELFSGIKSEEQAMAVFARIDRDKSGTLDISEFQRALRLLNFQLTEKQVWLIMVRAQAIRQSLRDVLRAF